MSGVKHTPGPLYPVWNGHYFDVCVDPNRYAQFVASTHLNRNLSVGFEEAEANATLYAAAPDLLQALINLVDALPSPEEMAARGQTEGPGLIAARAAIARAIGEQGGEA